MCWHQLRHMSCFPAILQTSRRELLLKVWYLLPALLAYGVVQLSMPQAVATLKLLSHVLLVGQFLLDFFPFVSGSIFCIPVPGI